MIHGTGANRVFPRLYSREELSQIEAPTMLIVGDHEKIYSPSAAIDAAARLIPGVTTELIPGAHHVAAVAQPALVNARILAFISKSETTRAAASM
jgi:pimeloyl-ACP methyl ester carboxylesterase